MSNEKIITFLRCPQGKSPYFHLCFQQPEYLFVFNKYMTEKGNSSSTQGQLNKEDMEAGGDWEKFAGYGCDGCGKLPNCEEYAEVVQLTIEVLEQGQGIPYPKSYQEVSSTYIQPVILGEKNIYGYTFTIEVAFYVRIVMNNDTKKGPQIVDNDEDSVEVAIEALDQMLLEMDGLPCNNVA